MCATTAEKRTFVTVATNESVSLYFPEPGHRGLSVGGIIGLCVLGCCLLICITSLMRMRHLASQSRAARSVPLVYLRDSTRCTAKLARRPVYGGPEPPPSYPGGQSLPPGDYPGKRCPYPRTQQQQEQQQGSVSGKPALLSFHVRSGIYPAAAGMGGLVGGSGSGSRKEESCAVRFLLQVRRLLNGYREAVFST